MRVRPATNLKVHTHKVSFRTPSAREVVSIRMVWLKVCMDNLYLEFHGPIRQLMEIICFQTLWRRASTKSMTEETQYQITVWDCKHPWALIKDSSRPSIKSSLWDSKLHKDQPSQLQKISAIKWCLKNHYISLMSFHPGLLYKQGQGNLSLLIDSKNLKIAKVLPVLNLQKTSGTGEIG